jgi:hypothetical protein
LHTGQADRHSVPTVSRDAQQSAQLARAKKAAAESHMAIAAALYFKHPADCDDEESLEERRGRTVLRTAM